MLASRIRKYQDGVNAVKHLEEIALDVRSAKVISLEQAARLIYNVHLKVHHHMMVTYSELSGEGKITRLAMFPP